MAFKISSPSDQVADYLREQLLKRRWCHELPGTPTLATELGLDRKTVIAAIKILEQDGFLESQGTGRPRKVSLPSKLPTNRLEINILAYEEDVKGYAYILKIVHQLQVAGHSVNIASKTLLGLGMDKKRIAKYVEENPADLWIPTGGSREVLEWFASRDTPTFAIFGRRRRVNLGSTGPDKIQGMTDAVKKLVSLGHRRIVFIAREERRKPTPGIIEKHFLKELESHGIVTSQFNLPNWQDEPQSFHTCIDKLFEITPPTALLLDEPQFFVAATQQLAMRGIVAPRDISLVCCDSSPIFDWCEPRISHISWNADHVVDQTIQWVEQLSRGKNDRKIGLTPAEFVIGGTIGPAPL